MNEFQLISKLTSSWRGDPQVKQGVGDDCAVITGDKPRHFWLLKTDAIVEGRHFTPETPPQWIGRKALARVLSDFAAMGGIPRHALVTLGLPPHFQARCIQAIYRGLTRLAVQYGCNLVGGETVRTHELLLSISALGQTSGYHPILRSGARAGDLIFVTGTLGRTLPRKHLTFVPRLAEGAFLARQRLATAMMDLSDGLGADLPRLARASKLGYQIQTAQLPLTRGATWQQACADGEDYELLLTVSPRKVKKLLQTWPFPTRLTRIGQMITGTKATQHQPPLPHGYDHLQDR